MARTKGASSYSKKSRGKDPSYHQLKADYYPVARRVPLKAAAVADHGIGDAGSILSRFNRRLYRQGKRYTIKIDIDVDAPEGPYEVYALADTWMLQKAWQHARATYMKATEDERGQSNTYVARWEDFRVNAGLGPSVTGQQLLLPVVNNISLSDTRLSAGEIQASQVVLEVGGTARSFGLGTTTALEFGILDEYDKVANTDSSPQTTNTGSSYTGVIGGISQTQQNLLSDTGNLPPYNNTGLPDGWVRVARLDNTSPNAQKLSTGFFDAPLGLFVVKPANGTDFDTKMYMTVQAGDYKGVKAHNMGV